MVKPDLSGHFKMDKTKVLMKNGRLIKVKKLQNALLNCIKRISIENHVLVLFLNGPFRQVLLAAYLPWSYITLLLSNYTEDLDRDHISG